MSRKSIYIAGKMTGVREYNYPKFFKTERKLTKNGGCTVVNPARTATQLFGENFHMHRYLTKEELNRVVKIELELLATCDSIYLLKGWETSKGTKKELQVALALGLEVICEDE